MLRAEGVRFPGRLRMSAEAYLRHLAAIRGVPAAPDLLEVLGFSGSRREPMARLSKGNAQKVGLAQALGGGPGLVVLDEPWAGLDAEASEVLLGLIADAAREASVLVTDHTGRAARITGARRVLLADGLLQDADAVVDVPAGPDVEADTAPIPATAIVLRCADPAAVAERLGVPGEAVDGCLHVSVPAAQADAVLLAALQVGCSVESVGPA